MQPSTGISTGSDVRSVVHAAFNSLDLDGATHVSDEDTFASLGVDSLGMSQVILFIEERAGIEISDDLLESLAEAENIGAVCSMLQAAVSERPSANVA